MYLVLLKDKSNTTHMMPIYSSLIKALECNPEKCDYVLNAVLQVIWAFFMISQTKLNKYWYLMIWQLKQKNIFSSAKDCNCVISSIIHYKFVSISGLSITFCITTVLVLLHTVTLLASCNKINTPHFPVHIIIQQYKL